MGRTVFATDHKPRRRLIAEPALFYAILVLNCLPVLVNKFFLTLDGPSHLYNASIIRELVVGNSQLLRAFYEFNPVLTPNWTSHFLLAILGFIFSGWFAEKIFILANLILLPLAFRYAVLSVSPGNKTLSFLIFPFCYTFLFQCGFFNFHLAFILMFFIAGWWYRRRNSPTPANVIGLAVLLAISFFSHAVVFAVTALLLFLLMLAAGRGQGASFRPIGSGILKRTAILLLAAVPVLILMAVFLSDAPSGFPTTPLTRADMSLWLLQVKPLILFNTDKEWKFTVLFNIFFLSIIVYAVLGRIRQFRAARAGGRSMRDALAASLKSSDMVLLLSAVVLCLYYVVPYNSGAGVMSDRLVVIFFMTLILWLALQELPKWPRIAATGAVLILNFTLMAVHFPPFSNGSRLAGEFEQASGYIREESVVLPVNWSSTWILGHVSGYLGSKKPVVLLDNYEALTAWFPLTWKPKHFPKVTFGDRSVIANTWWYGREGTGPVCAIDHVVLYGQTSRLKEPEQAELRQVLDSQYRLDYRSETHYVFVYTRKQ